MTFFGGDALSNDGFILIAGEAGIGTRFTLGPDARENSAAKDAVAQLRNNDGYEPAGYTLYAYAAVQAWAKAANEAGTTKSTNIAQMLRSRTFATALGEIGFDAKGDVTGIDNFVWYVWQADHYARAAQ